MSKPQHLQLAASEGARKRGFQPPPPGGGDGGGQDMTEERLTRLEIAMENTAKDADLRELRAQVEATLPHLSTKADISKLESTLIKWFIATAFAVSAIAFGVARFVL